MAQIARGVAVIVGLSLAVIMNTTQTASAEDDTGRVRVYIGTSPSPKSQGIYTMRMDLKTGALSKPELAAATKNPNFLAFHPSYRFVYACSEIAEAPAEKNGGVSAFSIDAASGKLTALNEQRSGGKGPCYVAVDQAGKNVLVANYGSGAIACVPIGDDGKLKEPTSVIQHEGKGTDPKRQTGPHAHSINLDANNRFAFAADLGLDEVLIYKFDGERGTLTPNDPPFATLAPGSGPRHLAWHPNGKYAYVNGEMGDIVTAFTYDAQRGALNPFQTISSLPQPDASGTNTTAEVVVHPNGKFLYVSNRGHDSIANYAIAADGRLTSRGFTPTQGQVPRNFAIAPGGQFLLAANQKSDNIVVFSIDQSTGDLTPTGAKVEAPAPVCIRFLPPVK